MTPELFNSDLVAALRRAETAPPPAFWERVEGLLPDASDIAAARAFGDEFEVTPRADMWDKITAQLDNENISIHNTTEITNNTTETALETEDNSFEQFRTAFADFAPVAPSGIWGNIGEQLDTDNDVWENAFGKLRDIDVPAPTRLWESLETLTANGMPMAAVLNNDLSPAPFPTNLDIDAARSATLDSETSNTPSADAQERLFAALSGLQRKPKPNTWDDINQRMEGRRFEQAFAQLKNYEAPAPEHTWAAIEETLEAEEERVIGGRLRGLDRMPSDGVWARVAGQLPLFPQAERQLTYLSRIAAVLLLGLCFVAVWKYNSTYDGAYQIPTAQNTTSQQPHTVAPVLPNHIAPTKHNSGKNDAAPEQNSPTTAQEAVATTETNSANAGKNTNTATLNNNSNAAKTAQQQQQNITNNNGVALQTKAVKEASIRRNAVNNAATDATNKGELAANNTNKRTANDGSANAGNNTATEGVGMMMRTAKAPNNAANNTSNGSNNEGQQIVASTAQPTTTNTTNADGANSPPNTTVAAYLDAQANNNAVNALANADIPRVTLNAIAPLPQYAKGAMVDEAYLYLKKGHSANYNRANAAFMGSDGHTSTLNETFILGSLKSDCDNLVHGYKGLLLSFGASGNNPYLLQSGLDGELQAKNNAPDLSHTVTTGAQIGGSIGYQFTRRMSFGLEINASTQGQGYTYARNGQNIQTNLATNYIYMASLARYALSRRSYTPSQFSFVIGPHFGWKNGEAQLDGTNYLSKYLVRSDLGITTGLDYEMFFRKAPNIYLSAGARASYGRDANRFGAADATQQLNFGLRLGVGLRIGKGKPKQ